MRMCEKDHGYIEGFGGIDGLGEVIEGVHGYIEGLRDIADGNPMI